MYVRFYYKNTETGLKSRLLHVARTVKPFFVWNGGEIFSPVMSLCWISNYLVSEKCAEPSVLDREGLKEKYLAQVDHIQEQHLKISFFLRMWNCKKCPCFSACAGVGSMSERHAASFETHNLSKTVWLCCLKMTPKVVQLIFVGVVD